MNKPYSITIDVGIINIGMCVINLSNSNETPYLEASNLLKPKDGRIYKEYEEGICAELVYTWLSERWVDFFNKARVVVIEKQYTEMRSAKERGCLVVESHMTSYLRAYIPFGGPLYTVIHPSWWKRDVGIELGGGDLAPIPACYTSTGEWVPPVRNPNHAQHKKDSLKMFKSLQDPEATGIKKTYGKELTTDMIEAYLIGKATRNNLLMVMNRAAIVSNHHAGLTSGRDGAVLKKDKRTYTLKRFPTIEDDDIPVVSLLPPLPQPKKVTLPLLPKPVKIIKTLKYSKPKPSKEDKKRPRSGF